MSKLLKIWCYDTEGNVLYPLYSESVPDNYLTDNRIVDAKAYAENGVDTLYFTDNYNEVRQIRCEIDEVPVGPVYNEFDLSLQRRGGNGTILADNIDSVGVGGTLLSGSYQFAYRMVNPETNKYTKWSALTNPLLVASHSTDGTYRLIAGVGLYTDKKITLTVVPPASELAAFSHYQLAVVENIYPIKDNISQPASLLKVEEITDKSAPIVFEYKANTKVGLIPIEDIVVDYAAIKTAKTLNVKQNRLFLGSLQYHELEVDQPTVTGSVITESTYNVTDRSFAVGNGSSKFIVMPTNSRVNWDTGTTVVANADAFVNTLSAPIALDFTASVLWAQLGDPASTTIMLVKNGTEVLDSDSYTTAPNGTATLSATAVVLQPNDYVDVRVTATIATGTTNVIQITTGSTFSGTGAVTIDNVNQNRGYFRDEVYRYGIVYKDKYGNKSAPVALDMTGVDDNAIDTDLSSDMRFPDRSTVGFGILDPTNSRPLTLGLNLTVSNHPSWAVAFEIVRVKRKKRIMFQTPVVPMMGVKGIGAVSNYPSKMFIRESTTATTQTYPDAQPQTSETIYVPKNLLWPELRDVVENTTTGGSNVNTKVKGEATLYPRVTTGSTHEVIKYDLCAIFPQQTMYGDEPFVPTGSEDLVTVDFALLKSDVKEYNDGLTGVSGDDILTNVSATFNALDKDEYFFNAENTLPINEDGCTHQSKISEYIYLDNLSQGTVVGGKIVMDYDKLQTSGISWGNKPSVNRMAIVKLDSSFDDNLRLDFGDLVKNPYDSSSSTTDIVQGEGVDYRALTSLDNDFVTEYTSYDSDKHVQSVRIANVANQNIGDDRYGKEDDVHEYISTGASHTFTLGELTSIASDEPTPISLDVWGGDCFVSSHIFKISDRTYSVVNQNKFTSSQVSIGDQGTLTDQWGAKLFRLGAGDDGGDDAPISMPIGLKGAAQFVQVYLESEYNGEMMDSDLLKGTPTGAYPVLNIDTESSIRVPLTYGYNVNISKQNDQKVYFNIPSTSVFNTVFPARTIYSDVKVYNSDIQGFDIFRVLNTFDLEEAFGALTKLGVAGDALYAIQERGIKYLPTGQSQLEQTDAGSLAVGTSDVIGRPITIDARRGSQHLGGIVETGSMLYIPDNINKAIYALAGQQLQNISAAGNNTLFRTIFATAIPERQIRKVYDPIRGHYWFITEDNCYLFNEAGQWVANHEFGDKLMGGIYTNQTLYLVGQGEDIVNVHSMYTGDVNSFMGTQVTPRVTFVVNPDGPISKTFDNLMFVASDRLDEVDFVVERESSLGNQLVLGTTIDIDSVEGNYRIKTLRDNNSARLRGLRLLTTTKWKDIISSLSTVLTKYRNSSRTPF